MLTQQELDRFFRNKVPRSWFAGQPRVQLDDDEILCVGALPEGQSAKEFRESTRDARMAIAGEAETRFRRKVSWGVEEEGQPRLFTTLSVPVMTRLRLPERAVLDTLVDAGVARSRSDALAWCVRLVGRHQADWLADLRGALAGVKRVRAEGPTLI